MSAPDFVQSGFAAVVLAAGEARRMGMNQPKVLLPWHPGATILDHILHQLTESGVIDRVIVVTGAYHEAVRAVPP
jgi:CTP:molybdopterin cytidylyltransferase MocA